MIIKDVRNIDLSKYREHLRESENVKPNYLLEFLFVACMFVLLFVILSS